MTWHWGTSWVSTSWLLTTDCSYLFYFTLIVTFIDVKWNKSSLKCCGTKSRLTLNRFAWLQIALVAVVLNEEDFYVIPSLNLNWRGTFFYFLYKIHVETYTYVYWLWFNKFTIYYDYWYFDYLFYHVTILHDET